MKPYEEVGPTEEMAESKPRPAISFEDSETWTTSAQDLIRYSMEQPPEPIIDGILNVGSTLLLHGNEESFKSIFVLNLAESLSSGTTLLRRWAVPQVRTVGVVDTEMNAASLGVRLQKMFPYGNPPQQMFFLDMKVVDQWRREKMGTKFQILDDWVSQRGIEVLIMDTVNDFFRGNKNPSDERAVGQFFDYMRMVPAKARILVRHDRKRKEHDGGTDSNQLIRGSSRFKEDPETILHLQRKDRRTHEVRMEAGKVRYAAKPEPLDLWFDAGHFRRTPLPPVIAVLEGGIRTREKLGAECQERFGLAQRSVDDMVDKMREFLLSGQDGHNRTLQIDRERAITAPWWKILNGSAKSTVGIESSPQPPGPAEAWRDDRSEPVSAGVSGRNGPVRA